MAIYYPTTANFIQKTLGAELLSGVTAAATLNNVTSIQNKKGVMIIDRIDTNNNETPSKVEVIPFDGTSGSTVTTLTRGAAGTSDQDHAVGAIVEFGPDIVWAQGLIDSFIAEHNEDGTHSDITATSVEATTITSGSVAVPTISSTSTLTNKRITKRVTTITSHATPTINTDDCDVVTITAQAEAITSMTTNLSGTPTNFQPLIFRIKDDGTARAITWGASFEARGVALPTTTVISKVLTVGFLYDTVTSKWGCVASAQEA